MPDIALLLGRLALVAVFLESGIGKFGGIAGALATKGYPAPLHLAGIAAAGELAGALGIAAGILTRVSALGLVVFTALATMSFHYFWAVEDAARAGEYMQFIKNLGLVGGLLVLTTAGPGRLSFDACSAQRAQTQATS